MRLYTFRSFADASFLLVALALAVASTLLVLATLVDHLQNYKYPALQTCCMRILLLAPIYALVSWCMMVFLPFAPFIEILRDFYETYALYCFWIMLVLWCGGQRRVVEVLDRDETLSCFLCPLAHRCGCGLPLFRFGGGKGMFRYLRLAIMQLMVLKPMVAFVCALIASSQHAKRIKQLRLLTVAGTAVAMHSIFTLYVTMKSFMRGLDASGKFLGIKVVVAIILVQQVGISVLVSMDLIPEGRFGYTTEEHAQRITCTATIIEMAIFSLLLSYLFSHRSMNHSDHRGDNEASLAPSATAAPAEGVDSHHGCRSTTRGSPAGGEGGDPVATRPREALFEQVMGDMVGHRKTSTEAVSLLSVFAMWDVLTMGRVEEHSMQCSAPGIPLPVELDDAEELSVSVGLTDGRAGPSLTKAVPSGRHARIGAVT